MISKKMSKIILHVFFPNTCILCNRVTQYDRIHCEECTNSLVIIFRKYKITADFCECYAPYYYLEEAREALLRFKYGEDLEKANKFVESMFNCLVKNDLLYAFDIIVCIPKYNPVEGEFNSSLELAIRLSKVTNKPILTDVLVKIKETRKQHDINYQDRLTNLNGAFHCPNPQKIHQKRILLVDDVCTSGSTFNTCAQTLCYFGSGKVIGISATISGIGN